MSMIKKYNINVNGVLYKVEVEEINEEDLEINIKNEFKNEDINISTSYSLESNYEECDDIDEDDSGCDKKIKSPIQGTILKIYIAGDEAIKKGQKLIVLESMKMESEICAPLDGEVNEIKVSEGETVKRDQVLVVLK